MHRDVKPSNVMIDDDRVKLVDFGIARFVDDSVAMTTTGRFFGTPGYLDPERVMGAAGDARSDVFAVGVVLFEMLAGTIPWRGRRAELFHEVVAADGLHGV